MLTIHVWPKWLKRFLLTHPLYKSPKHEKTARATGVRAEGRRRGTTNQRPSSSMSRASSMTSVPSARAFSVFVAPTFAPAMR